MHAANCLGELSKNLFVELLWNGLLPYVVYRWLTEAQHWTEYHALLLVTVIPSTFALWALLREKRLDPIAVISLVSILISLAMAFASSDARMLQIRESYLTGLFGLIFLASSFVHRPVLWWLAISQIKDPVRKAALEGSLPARQFVGQLTAFWGIVFVLEFAVKLWMIYTLPIATVLWLGNVVLYGITGVAALATFLWARRRNG